MYKGRARDMPQVHCPLAPLRFGVYGPKPYEFIGFGDIYGPKPYEFIRFGDIYMAPNPVNLQGFGDI